MKKNVKGHESANANVLMSELGLADGKFTNKFTGKFTDKGPFCVISRNIFGSGKTLFFEFFGLNSTIFEPNNLFYVETRLYLRKLCTSEADEINFSKKVL